MFYVQHIFCETWSVHGNYWITPVSLAAPSGEVQCVSESGKGTQHVSQQQEEQAQEKDRQTTNELITVNRKEEDQSGAA